MNCALFRKESESLFVDKIARPMSETMRQHASSCPECQSYYASMIALHSDLAAIPHEPIPPALTRQLKAIAHPAETRRVRLSWRFDVLRAAALLGPVALMFIVRLFPGTAGVWINFIVLTFGLTVFLITLLAPLFEENAGRPVSALQ